MTILTYSLYPSSYYSSYNTHLWEGRRQQDVYLSLTDNKGLYASQTQDCQETRTPVTFFLIFLTMDAPPFPSLAIFPLYVPPNRPLSPPPLAFIVASSLT